MAGRRIERRAPEWLAGVIVPLVAVGGCSTAPVASLDRPAATVTVTERAAGTSDSEPSSRGAQVVRVGKYGISFELPAGWMTLNAENVLNSSNPAINEVANRMGLTPDQLVEYIGTAVETLSITDQGAVEGFVDNVNSVGLSPAEFNDDQLKLQLAVIGAKVGSFEHTSSLAGEIIRVPYTWEVNGNTVNVVAIAVDVGTAATLITVSSHSATKAEELGDQIQASLRRIE